MVAYILCDSGPIRSTHPGLYRLPSFFTALCCLIIKTHQGGRYYPISQMWKLKLTEESVSKWKQWTQNFRLQVLASLLGFLPFLPPMLTRFLYMCFNFPTCVEQQKTGGLNQFSLLLRRAGPLGHLYLLMHPYKIFPNAIALPYMWLHIWSTAV